jgi:DNA-binding response OmpR family regulator
MTPTEKNSILVVDDDPQVLGEVKSYLTKTGYHVTTTDNGAAALKIIQSACPDLVVLDIVFEDTKSTGKRSMDGVEMLRRLRETDNVPVLMLSATNITAVKVMALSIGADDYLSKPFEMTELGARIDAILRRDKQELPGDKTLHFVRLQLDPGERRVWKDGTPIEVTGIEFDILYTLARRPEHVYTRDKLIEIAWKNGSFCVSKAVDVHIGHIRKKIEDDPFHPAFIVTVRGAGYRFIDVQA